MGRAAPIKSHAATINRPQLGSLGAKAEVAAAKAIHAKRPSSLGHGLPSATAAKPVAHMHPDRPDGQKLENSGRIVKLTNFISQDIYRNFANFNAMKGIQSQSLPSLTKINKGFRPGELTILTGPTGCGKTSLLSQLSLDFCAQGVPTLWGSFEIHMHKLMMKMLRQYGNIDLSDPTLLNRHYDAVSRDFQGLPMYFMDFFGSVPLESVLEVMAMSVKENNVQHIILDNLQFMLSGQERSNFDKYDLLDKSIAHVRQFASQSNAHITLVIHPRKEDDNSILGISSVLGTSKATQEADNVIILQRVFGSRYLDIRKNRFDGELGKVYLKYDPASLRVLETDPPKAPDSEPVKYPQHNAKLSYVKKSQRSFKPSLRTDPEQQQRYPDIGDYSID